MIQANELRIGNLVFRDELNIENGKWDKLTIKINYQDIFNLINGNDMVKTAYNPIPLTEEWLVKLGFEDDKANGFSKDSIHLEFIEQVGYVFFINGDVKGASITIEYVHTLQNLYFALRGQELTLR